MNTLNAAFALLAILWFAEPQSAQVMPAHDMQVAVPVQTAQPLAFDDDPEWIVGTFSSDIAECIGGGHPTVDDELDRDRLEVLLVPSDDPKSIVALLVEGKSGYAPSYNGYRVLQKIVTTIRPTVSGVEPDHAYVGGIECDWLTFESRIWYANSRRREERPELAGPGGTGHAVIRADAEPPGLPGLAGVQLRAAELGMSDYSFAGSILAEAAVSPTQWWSSVRLRDARGHLLDSHEEGGIAHGQEVTERELCEQEAALIGSVVELLAEPLRVSSVMTAGKGAILIDLAMPGGGPDRIGTEKWLDSQLDRVFESLAVVTQEGAEFLCAMEQQERVELSEDAVVVLERTLDFENVRPQCPPGQRLSYELVERRPDSSGRGKTSDADEDDEAPGDEVAGDEDSDDPEPDATIVVEEKRQKMRNVYRWVCLES